MKIDLGNSIYFLGVNNPSEKVFEGEIPLTKGMSYNSSTTIRLAY